MMSRKESLLATYNHEPHDHVGTFSDMCMIGGTAEYFEVGPMGGGLDSYGVKWGPNRSALGASVPLVGYEVFDDITEWESKVEFPDIAKIDWDKVVGPGLEKYDSEKQILEYALVSGPFLRLVYLMGFENGLIAMFEEPEACRDFFNAYTDYRVDLLQYVIEHFHPDSVCLGDDMCTVNGPFFSMDIYRDELKECHRRMVQTVKSYDIPVSFHMCGKGDDFPDEFAEIGCDVWQVCEPRNDLDRHMTRHKDDLAFFGCYDTLTPLTQGTPSEDDIRKSVDDCIDKYAPYGNFAILAVLMSLDVEETMRRTMISEPEVVRYGTNYYK